MTTASDVIAKINDILGIRPINRDLMNDDAPTYDNWREEADAAIADVPKNTNHNAITMGSNQQ